MKQNRIFIIVVLIFCNLPVFSQTFDWANVTEKLLINSSLYPKSMAVDNSGCMYSLGTFQGDFDFNPSQTVLSLSGNFNGPDVYLVKYDPNGNMVWVKTINTNNTANLEVVSVKLSSNGTKLYVCGAFSDSVDFNPSTINSTVLQTGVRDAFILCLDSSGQYNWVKTIGGAGAKLSECDMQIDANNNLVISGKYTNTVDFNPGAAVNSLSTSTSSLFILKLDENGSFVWVNNITGGAGLRAKKNQIGSNDKILFVGNFSNMVDFDPLVSGTELISSSASNIFMAWFDSLGNHLESKFISSQGTFISDISIENDNMFYLTGRTGINQSASDDFDPDSSQYYLPVGFFTVFVAKYDSSISLLWAKSITSNDILESTCIAVKENSNVYIGGYFEGIVDFDPGVGTYIDTAGGWNTPLLLSLTENGDFEFVHTLNPGWLVFDEYDCLLVRDNALFSSGTFTLNTDFDPGASTFFLDGGANATGTGNGFNFKWKLCNAKDTIINASGCSFTLNGSTYSQNGVYIQNYIGAEGCDSTITIVLNNSGTDTIVNIQACGSSYSSNNQTYTSSGTYYESYISSIGCDSNVTLNLTLLGTSSFSVYASSCFSYFFNNNVLYNSGTYFDTLVNSLGCDSVVTLFLTILAPSATSVFDTACGYLNYNGNFYFNSGVYVNNFVNANGCDSIVSLNLTVFPLYQVVANLFKCGPFSVNNQLYTSSGTYQQLYQTVHGCDSTITLNITITPIPPTSLSLNSCSPIVFDNQTYAASGTYNHIMQSVDGCDSLIVLTISINGPVNTITQNGDVLTADQGSPATYQWVRCNPFTLIAGANSQSYTATANGDYAVIVNANSCADTSACKTVSNVALNDLPAAIASLFPNPVKDELTLVLANKVERLTYDLCTASGQKLTSGSMKNAQILKLNTEQYSRGLYFIKIFDGEKLSVVKFIKE